MGDGEPFGSRLIESRFSLVEVGRLVAADRRDRRPVSAGYTITRTLFTDRQWAMFTSAFTHPRKADTGQTLAEVGR